MIRADPRQFDLFAPPPPPTPPARVEDGLAARIIAAGLEHNEWTLNNNRTLGGWGIAKDEAYPWNLPSRAMHFPIEFRGGAGKGDGWISLRHPELSQHPFVLRVGEQLGEPVPWKVTDEFGRSLKASTEWFHACDLIGDTHWRDMIDTRRFTTDGCIAQAVQHALHGKARLTLANARAVMSEIGAAEPIDRSLSMLMGEVHGLSAPSKIEERNGKGKVTSTSWPVNLHPNDSAAGAWAIIHAIEDGWFAYRGSYIGWTTEGRDRRASTNPTRKHEEEPRR